MTNTPTVIKFPQKLCAVCGRKATQSLALVDEYGGDAGQKHFCDSYPYCTDDRLVEGPLGR